MLAALAAIALMQCGPDGPVYSCPSRMSALGASCACAQLSNYVVVRGRPDGVVESGHTDLCSRTGSFDAADAGDFVSCGANTPRVMAHAVLAEPTGSPLLRTNYLLTSSQFDSDWALVNVNSAVPVVVADQAVSPLGTLTGDLATFTATTASDLSVLVKATGSGTSGKCPAVAHASAQVMIRGTTLDGGSSSGTIGLGVYDGTNYQYVACPYTGTTWTRCKKEDVNTTASAGGNLYIGNDSLISGVARGSQSVFLALSDCEEGPNASSPIDATSALSNGQQWTRMPDIVTANGGTRTAWIGDSLSANTVASTSSTQVYPRAPERYATRSGRTVDNWAVNGATLLTDIEGQWTTYGARTGAQRVIIWGGINDIIIGGVAGHTLWTSYLTFIGSRLAEGRSVVLVNLTPFKAYSGWSAGLETERGNFNSDMATYCVSNGGGAPAGIICIDMAAALWDPADHASLLAANAAPDGLHLSQTGATLAGDTVYAGAP